jgi:hypothetical protein
VVKNIDKLLKTFTTFGQENLKLKHENQNFSSFQLDKGNNSATHKMTNNLTCELLSIHSKHLDREN